MFDHEDEPNSDTRSDMRMVLDGRACSELSESSKMRRSSGTPLYVENTSELC